MTGLGEDKKGSLDAMIVEVLVTWLECSQSTITYGDLSKRISRRFSVPEPSVRWAFGKPLDRIQVACDDLGLPCLSALVVTKRGMESGTGFAASHRSRHPEDEGLSDGEIASCELSRVRSCSD